MKEAIGVGETILEAQRDACSILGVGSSDVVFQVLQFPIKKSFGIFGGKEAKVKAVLNEYSIRKFDNSSVELAYNYLVNILSAFNIKNLKVEKKEETENEAVIFISGEELGPIIGKHGVTLDSLQYLVNLVANSQRDGYFRVKIDVSDYKEKRGKALESLGLKTAQRVIKTHREFHLEPMSSYDRRIVHIAVRKCRGAESISQGDGIRRHIVIVPGKNVTNNKRPRHHVGTYQ
jgi:spoIIIJ-associated protein